MPRRTPRRPPPVPRRPDLAQPSGLCLPCPSMDWSPAVFLSPQLQRAWMSRPAAAASPLRLYGAIRPTFPPGVIDRGLGRIKLMPSAAHHFCLGMLCDPVHISLFPVYLSTQKRSFYTRTQFAD